MSKLKFMSRFANKFTKFMSKFTSKLTKLMRSLN